ncbi:MAG TPA: LCP family protein [Bacillota bacterium]|nr:LCP family protein [Bacillota bacterium]HQE66169.1 LCP family protein [Bacillota bacterium]HQJ37028.1 LCP family protein [Bacillota bacterium]
MGDKRKIIIAVVIAVLLVAAAIYGFTYNFLNKISVEEGAEGYPVPEKRVNVVVMGVANGLADTIMLASFNPEDGALDVLSIPRDTYIERKGHKTSANNKINSSYGRGGADNVVKSVASLTGMDVHYFVEVDYEAVKELVDAMGGIKVTVPMDMNYDDPVDGLHIHFKEGDAVSKGEDLLKLLRYRKNNKGGGYKDGDLGRVKMQQEIVRLGIEKVMRGNIVTNFLKLQEPVKKYVKTNMSPKQMMYYITKAKKIKKENISIQTIPGRADTINKLSFYVVNRDKMDEMLKPILEENK